MVNLDGAVYERRRTGNLLKVKQFQTLDLPILRVEEGQGCNTGTLGALVVNYEGNEVRVGTGFTQEQRDELWNDRELLTGTLVEVKYRERTTNQRGGKSLQHPTFVALRPDKTPQLEPTPEPNPVIKLEACGQYYFAF